MARFEALGFGDARGVDLESLIGGRPCRVFGGSRVALPPSARGEWEDMINVLGFAGVDL